MRSACFLFLVCINITFLLLRLKLKPEVHSYLALLVFKKEPDYHVCIGRHMPKMLALHQTAFVMMASTYEPDAALCFMHSISFYSHNDSLRRIL